MKLPRPLTLAAILSCALAAGAHALGRKDARDSHTQATDGAHTAETRAAEIKEKPDPFSEIKRDGTTLSGRIVLRMILRANGKVSDIKVLQGMTPELNKKAVKAAKKIKFIPAEKDGHPVSQWVTIEYNFYVY